ncbi:MAG: Sec-independent protein translocase protein TatB [Pseudonocardia sp.]
MFDSVGWGEILVLIVAGLFIVGPERLPSAAAWLGKTIRQVKEYATGAREQLRGELGPEFEEMRKPLDELRGLRSFNPRTVMRRSLFDDEGGWPGFGEKPNGFIPFADGPAIPQVHPATGPAPERLAPGERPPMDPDAT